MINYDFVIHLFEKYVIFLSGKPSLSHRDDMFEEQKYQDMHLFPFENVNEEFYFLIGDLFHIRISGITSVFFISTYVLCNDQC